MTQFASNSPAARIGRWKGEILKHSVPAEVLGISGLHKEMPKNSGTTVVYRRYLPYGGATTNATTINAWSVTLASHITQEGVTPPADSLTPQDLTVVMQQYSALYQYTDVVADMYEDDVPAEIKIQIGQRMGLLREMVRYGALKACTNVFYSGGTTRLTVDEVLSYNVLSKVARSLQGNRAEYVTRILSASPNFNTSPIQAAFLVFCHTDVAHDIRQIQDFVPRAAYAKGDAVHPMEIGSVNQFRIIISPELAPIADAGAAVAGLGLYSTTGTSADVYPVIVTAANAWGDIALRGEKSFTLRHAPPSQIDKNDILGQRGLMGAKFYSAAKVLNDGHMAVIEVAITAL